MMGDGFGHGIGGFWMALIWVVPLLLILWALVFRGRAGGTGTERRGKSALDALDEEYARGRIDRDEYLRRKQDLLGR
jgi:putative membrane protein